MRVIGGVRTLAAATPTSLGDNSATGVEKIGQKVPAVATVSNF